MTIGGTQNIFPPAREPIVNYDWLDLASGAGYIQYDSYGSNDSTGNSYMLVETRDAGDLKTVINYHTVGGVRITDSITHSGSVAHADFTKIIDIDWDSTEFQQPRIIKGRAYFRFYSCIVGTDAFEYYFIVRVRKWDGSTETEVASVQSVTETWVANQRNFYSLFLDISQTGYKKGDQLRISIEGWAKRVSNNYSLSLAGDPTDSAADGAPSGVDFLVNETRIISAIPYKIDI